MQLHAAFVSLMMMMLSKRAASEIFAHYRYRRRTACGEAADAFDGILAISASHI